MILIRYIAVVAFVLVVTLGAAAESAEHDVVQLTVSGEAPGGNNVAYQNALKNAQREAVLQILETTLSAEEFTLATPLIAQPERYIVTAEVQDKEKVGDATRVTLKLTLNETALKFDLAEIFVPRLADGARVLVLIAESLDGTPARVRADGVAQAKLTAYYTDEGLLAVPMAEVLPHYAPDDLAARLEGTPDDLAALARENLADVIVAGTARVAVEQIGGANVLRNEANLNLRVVTAQDAKLHGAYSRASAVQSHEVATGATMAVEDAVEKLQRRLFVATTMAALRAEPAGGVVLTVRGLSQTEFDAVNAWLGERYGEEAVVPLQFAPTRARVRVDYHGGMGDFMDALTLHRFAGGFRLDNKRAFGRSAELVVAGRDAEGS